MIRIGKFAIAASAIAAGLALSPSLRAEEGAGATRPNAVHRDMMQNMTGQMSQMMDECSKMMQSADHPGSTKPNQHQEAPPANPDKG